ncbi:lipopolysaccharide biosynthesis protein [Thermosipho affectus]|uniref:lipopolysaccharide biosynthesis protein n=1 Tax=Thermosipho affectus TaxID=660294 RepID=UPI002FCDEFE3
MLEKEYKVLAKNTVIISLGTFGSRAISFFLLPIFTRVLTKADYGKIDFFATTISLLLPFLTLGIVDAVFRFTMEKTGEEEKSGVLSSALMVSFWGILVFLVFVPIISKIESISELTIYMVFAFAINSVLSIFKTYIRAKQKLLIFALGDIIHTISFATLGIVFVVVLRYGIKGYFLGYILSSLVDVLFLLIFGKIYKDISLKNVSLQKIRNMLEYSIPLIPNGLSWWIMNVSDRYLIIFYLGFAANGIYSVSYKFMSLITILNGIFYQAWQISAVEQYKSRNKDEFYSKIFRILSTFLLLIVMVFSIVLKPIMRIMVGASFYEAWRYVLFLFLGAIFSAFSSFFGVGYIASKKTVGAFKTSVVGAMVNIGINIVFIPIIGAQAAAISTMMAFLAMWIMRIFETRKYFRIKNNWIKLVLSFLLVSLSLFVNFIQKIFIMYTIQIATLIVFILINRKEIKAILLKIKVAIISKTGR